MNFKLFILLALLAVASCGLFRDSSEEEHEAEYICSRLCPNDEVVRSCCRDQGFSTGYCTGYEYQRADCDGKMGVLRRIFGV